MGVNDSSASLTGWTPVRVDWEGDRGTVRWIFTAGIDFTEPAFGDTIRRARLDPFRLLFWRDTALEALLELTAPSARLEPAGFIFHLSRSGSTLVSHMLAGLPTTLVLSEPPPLDQVLRATVAPGLPEERVVTVLRALCAALGRPRRMNQVHVVIKFDAWAVRQWRLIRAAFPRTPCVFVYRDPVDVLLSHLDHRGMHMVPGVLPPPLLGFPEDAREPSCWASYGAAVLAGLCTSAADAARAGAVELVSYPMLPDAVEEVVAPRFGIPTGPDGRQRLRAIARRDAKNPVMPFVPTSDERRRRAPAGVIEAATDQLRPLYDALESIRTAGGVRP
jgi:hypothetical protein